MFLGKESTDKKVKQCRKRFLKFFPGGYRDETYIDWEREYKWNAHLQWETKLDKKNFSKLLKSGSYSEIANIAVNIESRTNLLFSFEKMALRDAVKSKTGAELFGRGLFDYLYGNASLEKRFEKYVSMIAELPRKQTRVLTWPLVTVFPFIAKPEEHLFLKPRVTQTAAQRYGFEFNYVSKPNWNTYSSLLDFAEEVRVDTFDLHPKDKIDLQSFIWVIGSEEYD